MINMKKWDIFLIPVILLLVTAVGADYVNDAGVFIAESCLNATHIQRSYEYNTSVGAEPTLYNYTQVSQCTNNCTDNKCNAMEPRVDINAMWVTFGAGLSFLLIGMALGMPFGKFVGKEEITAGWDTTIMVRYIFFFIGFYLVYLSFGMSRRVSAIYGGDANITDAASTATMVMRITMTLFLIVMMVETVFYILKYYQESSYSKKWGEQG